MTSFTEFLHSSGLIPRDVIADNRWHRCPTENHPRKRNGAYKTDGRTGACRDWAVHTELQIWKNGNGKAPEIDRAALRKASAAELRTQAKAQLAAREFYARCAQLRDGHPYLAEHGLDMAGCFGLRVDADGWLVVPMWRADRIVSVQRISPDGQKLFWKHAPTKGAYYVIPRKNASLTVVCEGLATGLALFAACPVSRVVCAFSASNLGNMPLPKFGLAVIASDNDHVTAAKIGSNPGVEAARAAGEALGVGVAVPEGMNGSDFCDLRQERVSVLLAEKPNARESAIKRQVDAEISAALMRQAKYLHA